MVDIRTNANGNNKIAGKKTLTIGGVSGIDINIKKDPPNKIEMETVAQRTDCRTIEIWSLVTKNGITINITRTFNTIVENLENQ
jgi:hypothetical protein